MKAQYVGIQQSAERQKLGIVARSIKMRYNVWKTPYFVVKLGIKYLPLLNEKYQIRVGIMAYTTHFNTMQRILAKRCIR